jgi:hypothetical protein
MLWAVLVGLVNCGAVFADQEEKPKNLPILQKWSGTLGWGRAALTI